MLRLRAVGYHAREGGYIDNLATGEKDINDVGVTRRSRDALRGDWSPDWFVDVSGVGQRIDGDDSQYADEDGSGLSRSSLVDQPFSSDFTLGQPGHSKGQRCGSLPLDDRRELAGRRREFRCVDEWRDPPASAAQQGTGAVSNETRLWRPMADGYSWLVGFSSIDHRYEVSVAKSRPRNGHFDLAGVENRVRRNHHLWRSRRRARTKDLEASFGARYTVSALSGSGEHLSPLVLATGWLTKMPSGKEHRFLPSAALLARPIEGLTLYARYQQGFRPGGLSIASDTVRLYRNDRLGTAEAGFRYGRPGRDSFDLQGSATLSRWKDIQADFLDASGLPVTDNIGDGRVWTVTVNGGVGSRPNFAWKPALP